MSHYFLGHYTSTRCSANLRRYFTKKIHGASGSFSTSHLLRPFSSFWNENLPLAKLKSVKLWIFQFRFRKKPSQLISKLFWMQVDCKEIVNWIKKQKFWEESKKDEAIFFHFFLSFLLANLKLDDSTVCNNTDIYTLLDITKWSWKGRKKQSLLFKPSSLVKNEARETKV